MNWLFKPITLHFIISTVHTIWTQAIVHIEIGSSVIGDSCTDVGLLSWAGIKYFCYLQFILYFTSDISVFVFHFFQIKKEAETWLDDDDGEEEEAEEDRRGQRADQAMEQGHE